MSTIHERIEREVAATPKAASEGIELGGWLRLIIARLALGIAVSLLAAIQHPSMLIPVTIYVVLLLTMGMRSRAFPRLYAMSIAVVIIATAWPSERSVLETALPMVIIESLICYGLFFGVRAKATFVAEPLIFH